MDKMEKKDKNEVLGGYINLGLDKETEPEAFKDGGQAEEIAEQDLEEATRTKKNAEPKSCLRQYAGMLLALNASLMFSIIVLLVVLLQKFHIDSGNASFWRYAGITLPSLPLLMFFETCGRKKTPECPEGKSVFSTILPLSEKAKLKNFVLLMIRGVLGSCSVIFRYYALGYLTIGDTSVISYSSPVLVTILAHFFLGEKTGLVPIGAALLTLGGVFVILRPPMLTGEPFDERRLTGTLFALGSLCCNAVMTVITRGIREVQFSLMLVVFGGLGMLQSFIMSMWSGGLVIPESFEAIGMLGAVFALSFVGQMSILLGLKFEQAGPVALIRTCDVIWGFLLQFAVLKVVPDFYSGLGGGIVFSCIIVIATRKWISSWPTESKARNSCFVKFLLL